MNGAVSFSNICLRFGKDVVAADNLSFDVKQGEFFSLLGPSGSGKTSCLRLIAGFEKPDSGEIYLDGEPATSLPPFQRNVNTVFQDYALFPHMTVRENVAYSLMIRKVPTSQRNQHVDEMLELVQLPGVADRKPAALSGGQRQRVSLARALINHPRVLLLDEPLGALDLKLREQMQLELKELQREVGITFIYVTHDQQEALTMSDRIAIFNHGKILQTGTPSEIYEYPQNRFVAGFVGSSNLLDAKQADILFNLDSMVSIRPECLKINYPGQNSNTSDYAFSARVVNITYQGSTHRVMLDVNNIRLNAIVDSREFYQIPGIAENTALTIQLSSDDIHKVEA